MALALVLCVSAGLAIKSFTRLRHIDPGYRPEGVLTARVAPSGNRYEKDADLVAFYDALLTSLRAQPGMVEAAATARLPLDGLWVGTSFLVRDRPEPPRAERPVADIRVVTPRYFATLGIPIRSGRDFDASDREGVPYVVVINETMARTFWPDGSAIGRPVAVSLGDPYLEATVVGVVGDVKHQGYDTTPRAMIYFAHGQLAVGTMSVALRTDADPSTLAPVLRAGVAAQDPMVPVYTVAPMTDLVDRSMAADRFGSSLLGGFAALALVLAAVGTYGVVAYGVTRRGREIGIRVALGAADGRVMGMVVRDGMRPVWIGVGAGIVAGLLLTRFLGTLLFDVSPTDPMTFGAGAGVLLLAALTACVIPARRAARIDPLEAIRHE